MIKRLFVILLCLLLFACSQERQEVSEIPLAPEENSKEVSYPEVNSQEVNSNLIRQYNSLREEIDFVRGGGISPERRSQILAQIEDMKKQGYNPDDLEILRQNLDAVMNPISQKSSSLPEDSCQRALFQFSPVNLEKVEYIVPLGQMAGEHVTPTDHQYYYGPDWVTKIEIYSPADGKIKWVQHMTQPVADPGSNRKVDDYYILIDHGCGLESAYIHVDFPISEIVKQVGSESYTNFDMPVKAGQFLGTYDGAVDYNVFDKDANVTFAVPQSYANSRYLEVKDPFLYFTDSVKSKMIAKSLRSVPPFGGKIDTDVDGTLAGTWFEEGTNKFAGLKLERYWAGHLSFAPNNIDPDLIMVSIGTFTAEKALQFAVAGNTPNPVTIKPGATVKYELVSYQFYDSQGKAWDRQSFTKPLSAKPEGENSGVILVEMLEKQKIKVEIFPGKKAAEVNGFSGNEKIFVR